ncbi:MAG: YcgL domain-containing protein [Ectothiorhodospiraceae bacterium]|nr:YcgL domain-containing protein [Ectothiorhodospiraceae bacterium]MCH8504091.1 YcgL domain-containing protein [Ectothiorhodospiraceae bacterium]
MHCSVYKGAKAPDHYLFLPRRDDFSAVPQPVLDRFGPLEHVMDLVLTPERPLARLTAPELMRALLQQGCHVQLPPREDSDH